MTYLDDQLTDVRERTEASPGPLREARLRLQTVRSAAGSFEGSLRTYRSGSLATHLMNDPVSDGDGGLVLDRRKYPALGPEGGGELPEQVAADLCAHIGPTIRIDYPNAKVHTSKRGPKIHFGQEVDGQNPTVDLVVALTRRDGDGLWIPNLTKNRWEPSDPEGHLELLNSGAIAARRTRRRITRLAKTWNGQFEKPGASSFQLGVWALEFVTPRLGIAGGLWTLFDSAATRLEADEPTPDPAGVSEDLKLQHGVTVTAMAKRLRTAADHLRTALDSPDDTEVVDTELAQVFWKYLDAPTSNGLKAATGVLKVGAPLLAAAVGVSVAAASDPRRRSFGGDR